MANPFDAMPEGPTPDAAPTPAMLTISEPTHDFHDVQMGTESFATQFVVTNGGELASGAIAVSLGGTNMDSFIIVPTGDNSDCAGQQLGAGKTCIVQVKYHAGAKGPESAVLHVDADPGGMPIVGLSGNSFVQGSLEVTAGSTLDFGNAAIQSMTASKTITIHNTGDVPCTNVVIAIGDTTNYMQTSTTCTTNLAANASCDVSVRFNPITVGSHANSITISSDQAEVAPQTKGTGTADVMVTKTGTGTVADTLSSAVISCGGTCKGTYGQTPITLHASTTGGIPFNTWGGACVSAGTNADCTLALTQPMSTVTANFGVCAPGTGVCTSGSLTTCDSTGQWSAPSTCALGCFTDGTRCWDVDPTNGLAAQLDASASQPSFVLTDGAQISTTDGTVTNGDSSIVMISSEAVQQATGYPAIRVFKVKSIKMGGVKVVGSNALAIVSDGDIEIDGILNLSVKDGSPGRMLCAVGAGVGGQSSSNTRRSGSGGGGFSLTGGRGGNNPPTAGGAGGTFVTNGGLSPLRGGCDGGSALSGIIPSLGVGGGAVQLVSRTLIKVVNNGGINAGGSGAPGRTTTPIGDVPGGGGGGAGGGVLLEAPNVIVNGSSAIIATNGGGGSADCAAGTGEDAHASSSPALGGACVGDATRTSGGKGWSMDSPVAQPGGDFTVGSDAYQAGGGGGAPGVIRALTISSTMGYQVIGGAKVSGNLYRGAVGKR